MTPAERFFAKVEKTDNCWLWTAALTTGGYGKFKAQSYKVVEAHRWAYEFLVGPIPEGLTIDHLCRVRRCVNPDHLEAVTGPENTRRATAARTHCSGGHPYAENAWVGVSPEGYTIRHCNACSRARKREAYARKKASA